jgi:hypothetical protein
MHARRPVAGTATKVSHCTLGRCTYVCGSIPRNLRKRLKKSLVISVLIVVCTRIGETKNDKRSGRTH